MEAFHVFSAVGYISAVAAFYWFPSANVSGGRRIAAHVVYVPTSAPDQSCQTDIKTCT